MPDFTDYDLWLIREESDPFFDDRELRHLSEEEQPQLEATRCRMCSQTGGVPFLMIDDDLCCSKCFIDWSPEEFHQWLHEDPPRRLQILSENVERESLVEVIRKFPTHSLCCASPERKAPATCVQRPTSTVEEEAA